MLLASVLINTILCTLLWYTNRLQSSKTKTLQIKNKTLLGYVEDLEQTIKQLKAPNTTTKNSKKVLIKDHKNS